MVRIILLCVLMIGSTMLRAAEATQVVTYPLASCYQQGEQHTLRVGETEVPVQAFTPIYDGYYHGERGNHELYDNSAFVRAESYGRW